MKLLHSVLTIFSLFIATMQIMAEEISSEFPSDSVPTYNLEEVQVNAAKVIRKADMDLYHPSEDIVNRSQNGLQLLSNLMIPSLMVDEMQGKILAAGMNVQLRINGREVSAEQVRNLSPASIKKVEWINNPGLRYNGADYVLNIIVNNPTAGGSLSLGFQQCLNLIFGYYNADIKLNHGRSQWSISANGKPTSINKAYRDYYEKFTFPDGEIISRSETPISGNAIDNRGYFTAGYSYIKSDTTVFYAQLTSRNEFKSNITYKGLLSINDIPDEIILTNGTDDSGGTPSLSLYLEQHFQNNQLIVVDFNASLFSGHSSTDYIESLPGNETTVTDIRTYIKDFNQAYGLQANYIRNLEQSRFTGGISYSANRNRSRYPYLDNSLFHQHQDKVYVFAEYFHRINKFTITAGLGAQYTSFIFKETEEGSKSWNLRPQATLTYTPASGSQFRLNFSSWQTAPSLAETNIAPQQTDGFQWNIGNPELKTYNNYRLNFRYAFTYPRISGNFNVSASTSPHAIAPFLFWNDDKLITSYENSFGRQTLAFSVAPQIEIIPGLFFLSGYVEFLNERTHGNGYKLYNHNWNYYIQGMFTHRNFTFMIQYSKARRTLTGERISWGEDFSNISLLYNYRNWQFGIGSLMPFGRYDQGSKMISKWNSNEYHMRVKLRSIGIVVNYNLNWGKQKKGISKLIDTDANIDKSSAKTR